MKQSLGQFAEVAVPFFKIIWRRRTAAVGMIVVIFVCLVAIFAPLLATHEPIKTQLRERMEPPGSQNWLGTDYFGRDVYSRMVWGSRISLQVAFAAVLLGGTIGVTAGLTAGYFGGVYDRVISSAVDIMMAFPMLLLAIAVVAMLGGGLSNLILAVGFASIPRFARLVRGEVAIVRNLEYVEAARAAGASHLTIMIRHVLRNVTAPLLVLISQRVSTAIITESSLSFLGLGIRPPTPTWGNIIAEGRPLLESAPWVALLPGVAIIITVLGFNLFGDGLRDALDPRLRGRA